MIFRGGAHPADGDDTLAANDGAEEVAASGWDAIDFSPDEASSAAAAAPERPAAGSAAAAADAGAGVGADASAGAAAGEASPVAAPAGRSMDALEVARSVEQATKMKEQLANDSIHRAKAEVLAQRAALQAQMAEQERLLREEEARLAKLEQELRSGCNKDERLRVEALRKEIETCGRDEKALEREVARCRDTMRKATDAYVDAEERLNARRKSRKELEEEMTQLILATGKAKDEKLTGLLMQVSPAASPTSAV